MVASLEYLCIKSIIGEFERIYFASTVSNDEILQRNLEFLRRKYSSLLLSKLSKKRKLKNNYLNFLINEHVKYFLYNNFSRNLQDPVKDIFCRLPNLTELSCHGLCTDEILNIATFCPKLVLIDAKYSYSVTDIGVKYLCKNTNGGVPCSALKFLNIDSTEVTPTGVEYALQNLSSLEILVWRDVPDVLYSLYKTNKLPICKKICRYNLIELKFSSFKFYEDDIVKICLIMCPKLKSMKFSLSDKDQLSLFNNIALERLCMEDLSYWKSDSPIDISNFLKMNGSDLVYLKISNCMMSVHDLALCCPKLENLYVEKVTFLNNGTQPVPVFNCLETCVFYSEEDDIAATEAIRLLLLSSPKLRGISFMYCDLSALSKTHILKCCENQPIKLITFQGKFEITFVKNILLLSRSLSKLYLGSDLYDEMKTFAKTLPNKPNIYRKTWMTQNVYRRPWIVNHIPCYS